MSLLIGTAGKSADVTLDSSNVPASSSDRQRTWKLCPWRWKGWRPGSMLLTTMSTIWSFSRTKGWVYSPYTRGSVARSPELRAV